MAASLTMSRKQKKLPRSYRPGKLLTLVANEFKGFQLNNLHPRQVEFVAADGLSFTVTERVDRQFMAHTVIAQFEYRVTGSQPGQAEIHLSHTGSFKRTGLGSRVKQGGNGAAELITRLQNDESFIQAMLPLDFKTFHLIQDEHGWRAITSQIGASWVAIAFPPVRRYVPMGSDQVETLLVVFNRLQALLGS